MKTTNILILLSLIFLTSCSHSGNSLSTSSDSTNVNDNYGSNSTIVESAELFSEFKNDVAIASEKYMNKRIIIKNMIICGGYSDENKIRQLIGIPVDQKSNKMGYLYEEFRTSSYLDNLGFNEATIFWNEYIEGRLTLLGSSIFYLGNNKLNKLYDGDENLTVFRFGLKSPMDYKKLNLPKLIPAFKDVSIASFIEVVDIEGTVDVLSGGANDAAFIGLTDCIILKQTPHAATNISNIINELKTNSNNKQMAKDQIEKDKKMIGSWTGLINGKKINLDINDDSEYQSIKGEITINGVKFDFKGNKKLTKLGGEYFYDNEGEITYDFNIYKTDEENSDQDLSFNNATILYRYLKNTKELQMDFIVGDDENNNIGILKRK